MVSVCVCVCVLGGDMGLGSGSDHRLPLHQADVPVSLACSCFEMILKCDLFPP